MIEESSNSTHYSEDSTGDFFEAMERDVNSIAGEGDSVQDSKPMKEVNPKQTAGNTAQAPQRVDWKKRYQDSSREAKRMHSEMQNLRPYGAIIQAMKKDGGLVEHVRDYLTGGGSNSTIQNKLGLAEDFEFDADELGDPGSDSSKVLNAHVDGLVASRLQQFSQVQDKKVAQQRFAQARLSEEKQFRQDHPDMTDDQYKQMLETANTRRLSLEDIHYIINRDSTNNKVAMNVKKDMVEQMKNARNIPASTSSVNSAPHNVNQDDNVFNALKGVDEELDNLFGDK